MARSTILALSLFALLATSLAAAQDAPAPAPAPTSPLVAVPDSVDFGDAFQGEVLTREVQVTNSGSEAFPLSSIQTSCGCTAAQIVGPDGTAYRTQAHGTDPILILEPEDEATVIVEFRTAGKHGDINQTMKLFHSDPRIPALQVGVHVRVTKAIQVTPAWVNLNRIGKSDRIEEVVVVEAVEIGDWTISGFASQIEGQELPSYLNFEVLDEEGPRRRVKVVVEGDRPVGALSARVSIQIDHERIKTADFAVTAIIQPNVTFESGNSAFQENVNFEQLGPEDTVTRTIKITNKDPAVPYVLTGVDILTSKKEFFEVSIREIEAGLSYEVDVTVDGAINAAFFRGSIVLRAEHPDLPTKMIPFHGWVRE